MSSLAARRIQIAVLIATIAVTALLAAWIISPEASLGRVMGASVATLPLWIFIPALSRKQRRAYAAMTLCVVPYLVAALTELIANPGARIWASTMLVLTFGLFVLLIAVLRVTRNAA